MLKSILIAKDGTGDLRSVFLHQLLHGYFAIFLVVKYHRDKPVANHFKQAGHSIHNVRVKGLWLLFTDTGRGMKGMESYLIEKLGSEQPGGINEKQPFKYYYFYISTIKLKCSIHFMFLRLNHWFILS